MGIKERKERERSQRCSEILEAAKRIFEEKGFLNTTLQDVAQEAEISVGLIYRHFISKEDIFASLALKCAIKVDESIKKILNDFGNSKLETILQKIARAFFEFYGPYGEYFDFLLYSYKGYKKIQIKGTILTRLMSVTLRSLERLKKFIVKHPQFRANTDDEALKTVFLLWAILLGSHKLFDNSGRGHLFAYTSSKEDFVSNMINQVLSGIVTPKRELASKLSESPSKSEFHESQMS